jgi:hypothetical protein
MRQLTQKKQGQKTMSLQDADSATTNTPSKPKRRQSPRQSQSEDKRVLSQEELRAWWPFDRLDPKRFPKTKHEQEQYEDAPI